MRASTSYDRALTRLREFAVFQGVRSLFINELDEKVFTTGCASCSTFEDFRISGFCLDRPRAGAKKTDDADQYIKTRPGEGTRSSLQPIPATFIKEVHDKSVTCEAVKSQKAQNRWRIRRSRANLTDPHRHFPLCHGRGSEHANEGWPWAHTSRGAGVGKVVGDPCSPRHKENHLRSGPWRICEPAYRWPPVICAARKLRGGRRP